MRKELRDFDFSKRAASYDKGLKGRVSKRFYNLLEREMIIKDGMRLLDVGCGTGTLITRLCATRSIEAHGIDVEINMIDAAKQHFPAGTFRLAPSEKIPYPDESFDVLTACMAYHHFHDKAGFAQEASRTLKSGGCLYIADVRFPLLVLKTLNGLARLFRVVGEFFTAQELTIRFAEYGFQLNGMAMDDYAQVVSFVKTANPCSINTQTALPEE